MRWPGCKTHLSKEATSGSYRKLNTKITRPNDSFHKSVLGRIEQTLRVEVQRHDWMRERGVVETGIQNFIWIAEFSTLRLCHDRLRWGCSNKWSMSRLDVVSGHWIRDIITYYNLYGIPTMAVWLDIWDIIMLVHSGNQRFQSSQLLLFSPSSYYRHFLIFIFLHHRTLIWCNCQWCYRNLR